MKKLIAFMAIVFFVSACGSRNDTTTCTSEKSDYGYEAKIESKDDKVLKITENLSFSFETMGLDKDTAKSYVEYWKSSYESIDGVTFTSKINNDDENISVELIMDFEKADMDTLISNSLISEELLAEKDGKQYPSLKTLVESNEANGQTCK